LDYTPFSYVTDLAACGHLPGKPLEGRPVDAQWDPGLRDALKRRGTAVHEEQLIEALLHDLHRAHGQGSPYAGR
jgi:hypothetical protein